MKISIGRLKEIIMEEVAKAASVEEAFKPASEMPPEWQAKAQPGSPAARQLQIPKCNTLLQQMEDYNEEMEDKHGPRFNVWTARKDLQQSPEWLDCEEKGLFAETEIGKANAANEAKWDAINAADEERIAARLSAAKAAAAPPPPRRRDPYLSETLNIEIVDDE
jgi:hypothetical protein